MRYIILFFLALAPMYLSAQNEIGDAEEGRALSKQLQFGAHFGTRGWGLNTMFGLGKGETMWMFGVQAFAVKHEKETRITSLYQNQGSRYIYDKLNRFYVISPMAGPHKTLLSLGKRNQVQIHGGIFAGPAIGLLRPYYLDIAVPLPSNPGFATLVSEPYDPTKHDFGDIVGASAFFAGDAKVSTRLGLSARAFIQFDFAQDVRFIRGIEMGINTDLFFNEVPIMGFTTNHKNFVAFTIGATLGNKW